MSCLWDGHLSGRKAKEISSFLSLLSALGSAPVTRTDIKLCTQGKKGGFTSVLDSTGLLLAAFWNHSHEVLRYSVVNGLVAFAGWILSRVVAKFHPEVFEGHAQKFVTENWEKTPQKSVGQLHSVLQSRAWPQRSFFKQLQGANHS